MVPRNLPAARTKRCSPNGHLLTPFKSLPQLLWRLDHKYANGDQKWQCLSQSKKSVHEIFVVWKCPCLTTGWFLNPHLKWEYWSMHHFAPKVVKFVCKSDTAMAKWVHPIKVPDFIMWWAWIDGASDSVMSIGSLNGRLVGATPNVPPTPATTSCLLVVQ